MNWLHPANDGCVLTVKVTPRANKSEIVSADSDWLRVRLKASPVDGKANIELTALFARTFNVSKSSVEILTGDTSRIKRIKLRGVSAEAVMAQITS